MNTKVSPSISECRHHRWPLPVAKSLLLIAAMVPSSALFVSAQNDSTARIREETPAPKQFVSTNQLLTPEKAQRDAQRAREAFLRGRYEEAQKQVTHALEICPNCAIPLTLQGALKVQARDYPEAVQQFQKAINADPTLGAAYIGLGQTYNMLGRFKEALVSLNRGVAILPAAWAAHFEKALAHLGVQESEAALEEIARAEHAQSALDEIARAQRPRELDQQRRSALSYLRAYAYLQQNHDSDAKTALEEAVKQDPKGEYAALAQRKLNQLTTSGSGSLEDRQ